MTRPWSLLWIWNIHARLLGPESALRLLIRTPALTASFVRSYLGIRDRAEITTCKTTSDFSLLEVEGLRFRSRFRSHFIYYQPISGRRAVVPQHNRDMPKGTLMSLLREAGFTREELIEFLSGV